MLKNVHINKSKKRVKINTIFGDKYIIVRNKNYTNKLLKHKKEKKETQYYSGRDYFDRSVREKNALMRDHIRAIKASPFKTLSSSYYLRNPDEQKIETEISFLGGNLPIKTLYRCDIQSFKSVLEDSLMYSNMRKNVFHPKSDELNNPPAFSQLVENSDIKLDKIELGELLEKEHNIDILNVTNWNLTKNGNYFSALKTFPFIAFQLIRECSVKAVYMDLITTREADGRSCDGTIELLREYEENFYSQTGKNLFEYFGDRKSVIIPLTDDQNNIDWEAIRAGTLNLNQTVNNTNFFYKRFAQVMFPKFALKAELDKWLDDDNIIEFIMRAINYGNYTKGEFKYFEAVGLPKFVSQLEIPTLIGELKTNEDLIENLAQIYHYIYGLAKELHDYLIQNKQLIIQNKNLMAKELLFLNVTYYPDIFDKKTFIKNGLRAEYNKVIRYEKIRLGSKGLKTGRDSIYIEYPFEFFIYMVNDNFKGEQSYRDHLLSQQDSPLKDAVIKMIDKFVEKELSKR